MNGIVGEKGLEIKDIEGLQKIDNFLKGAFTRVFGKQKMEELMAVFTRFITLGEGNSEEIATLHTAFSDKGLATYFKTQANNIPSAVKKIGGIAGLILLTAEGQIQAQVRELIAQTASGKAHMDKKREEQEQRLAGEKAAERAQADAARKDALKQRKSLIEDFFKKNGIQQITLLGTYDSKHPDKSAITQESTKDELQNADIENDALILEIGETGKIHRKYRITSEGRVEKFSGGIWKFVRNIKKVGQ